MDGINAIGGAPAASPAAAATNSALGKDDFLKLLVTQLQHQDPLNPMEDKEFIGQMAQFTSLEQLSNLAGSMDELRQADQISQGIGLIGHELTYETPDGALLSGTATSVSVADGVIQIEVNGETISPGAVRTVR